MRNKSMHALFNQVWLTGFLGMFLVGLVPDPVGGVLFWSVVALQAGAYAVLLRRRTPLLFSCLGMALAATTAMAGATLHAAGHSLLTFPTGWAIAFWSSWILVVVIVCLDPVVHPEAWRAWREHMDDCTAWDVLKGHHIPDLGG